MTKPTAQGLKSKEGIVSSTVVHLPERPRIAAKTQSSRQRETASDGWNLPANDRHFIPWVKNGDYQDKLWQAICRHISFEVDLAAPPYLVAIDIGAHVGFFTERMADLFTVVAFEPVPTNFECLRLNITHPNAILVNLGVGAWGNRELYLGKGDNSGSWSASRPEAMNGEAEIGQAPMVPLDCFAFTGKIGLIKLDIQGMELEALQTGKNLLEKHKPVVAVEVKSDKGTDHGPQKFLESLGASVVEEVGKDIIMKW